MARDSVSLPVFLLKNDIDQFEVTEWEMQDKCKWLLIKCGRRERYLRRAGQCLPYTANMSEPTPQRTGLFFPHLKRLFLLPAFVSLVVHMASQVYSLGLKGAIVTLSSLGICRVKTVAFPPPHPRGCMAPLHSQGRAVSTPREVT